MIIMKKSLPLMHNSSSILSVLFIILACLSIPGCQNHKANQKTPLPTNDTIIKEDMENGNRKGKRDAWLERMHKTADGVNWKKIELENALSRQTKYSIVPVRDRSGDVEIANGKIAGKWSEKGSDNLAGNVKATIYDHETDRIFVIADGGSIFSGNRQNERWEVINQDIVFDGSFLERFDYKGEKRMIASSGAIPMFSDDNGLTWTASAGIDVDDSNARSFNCVLIGREDPYIYIQSKSDYWAPLYIYRSTNGGKSFHPIRSLGSEKTNKFWLTSPPTTNDLFLFDNIDDKRADIYQYAVNVNTFWPIVTTTDLRFSTGPTIVQSVLWEDAIQFFTYAEDDTIKVSIDTGRTWMAKGVIPEHPWSRRFFVFPSDPNHMLAGGVELFSSHDGGNLWTKVNQWWEYYDDVPNKIHADMMYFREFYQPDDDQFFTLISNHGGMSMTTDYGMSTPNIGMKGLNVSQYYSVRTDPLDPSILYAGAQDQGFQRGFLGEDDNPSDFTQLISGDYGHIVFSEMSQRLWTVYPNGSVSYYQNPQTDFGPTEWYDIESENETVWIPPMVESPATHLNEIFIAGGNINGGTGSHLIKLTYESFQIEATQFDYDFLEANLGEVTSMAFSPLDAEKIYVGTYDGGFFTSFDGGLSWTQNVLNGPGAQYLYGNDIYASHMTPGMVLYAGSGYSNAPIFISYDDGSTFEAMDGGLPPTLVIQVAANEDESMFFAATESGPYLFLKEDERWYPMSAGVAPSARFWSVEYLEGSQTARFGTYGRGAWDFQLKELTSTKDQQLEDKTWSLSPNPAVEDVMIHISAQIERFGQEHITLYTVRGEMIHHQQMTEKTQRINLDKIPPGVYFVQLNFNGKTGIKKLIKQ
jgi:photosystem II stability/assembly factor-like uncharacterized protein